MTESNTTWEAGDVAWCEEFGIVTVEETYPAAADVKNHQVIETTDLSNLKERAPISEWEWENRDVDMAVFHGKDPKGRVVARRTFELVGTDVLVNGDWHQREDHGSWDTNFGGKGIEVNE